MFRSVSGICDLEQFFTSMGKSCRGSVRKRFYIFLWEDSNNILLDRNILSMVGKRFHLQPCAQKAGSPLRLWANCYFKQYINWLCITRWFVDLWEKSLSSLKMGPGKG